MSGKRIVFIHGSPRLQGNTRAAARAALDAARACGAEVAEIEAVKLDFRAPGCIGCHKCQESREYACALGDELGRAVAGLPAHDVIALCTPVFWMSYTAQLKMFIDRMYSLFKFTPDGIRTPLARKTLALLAVAGGPIEDNLDLVERQLRVPADMVECCFESCLIPFAPWEPGALAADAEAMARAAAFGRLLAGCPDEPGAA